MSPAAYRVSQGGVPYTYLGETLLGACGSWTVLVSGASCESGTVLVVFSGTGLDATIFATVLWREEVGMTVFSSSGGGVEENDLELE